MAGLVLYFYYVSMASHFAFPWNKERAIERVMAVFGM
jgi:hypothetical protein